MICTHCGTEWSMQKNASQSKIFCPGCGKPVSAEPAAKERMDTLEDCLRYLFQKFGAEPFQAGNMLISLHSDLMPQRQKDRRLLTVLVNCNGHTALLAAKRKPESEQPILIARLTKQMQEDWLLQPGPTQEVISAFWLAIDGSRDALKSITRKPAGTTQAPAQRPVPPNAVCCPADYIIVNGILKKYTGTDPVIRVPDGVKEIADGSFSRKYFWGDYAASITVREVYLPDSVNEIHLHAFTNCGALQSITLPRELHVIGYGAFWGCSSLKSIVLPSSLHTIHFHTFHGCSALESITFPNGLNTIRVAAFCGCSSLKSIVLPSSLHTIESHAFCKCSSLKHITIPDSLKKVEEKAFVGCSGITVIASDAWKKAHPDLLHYIEHPSKE